MAELAHTGAYSGLARGIGTGGGVTVMEVAGLAMATVIARRGKAQALAEAVAETFGIALADGPKRVAAGPVAFVGTGPQTWLAVAQGRPGFVSQLQADLAGIAAVFDQSDALAMVRLSGPRVAETMEKGVRIDLHPDAFGQGDAAVTAIAHIGATLWRTEDGPGFDIAVPRSLAESFRHWLEASAAAHGLAAAPAGRPGSIEEAHHDGR